MHVGAPKVTIVLVRTKIAMQSGRSCRLARFDAPQPSADLNVLREREPQCLRPEARRIA